jgi:TRAP-type C4-dicarboxylate transport system permease small subunit
MDKADRLLWRSVDVAILIAVLGMVCLIALQVGSRFVDASVPWTEELSRFLFIWTVWLGLAASFRAGAHPSLDILSMAAPDRLRFIFRAVQVVATVMLFAAVSWHGLRLLRQQIVFGEQSPILQVGMWVATLPLVLGAALSILGAVVDGLLGQRHPDDAAAATAPAKEPVR